MTFSKFICSFSSTISAFSAPSEFEFGSINEPDELAIKPPPPLDLFDSAVRAASS